jgi:DNA-binding CsgD family transcriptional regulator
MELWERSTALALLDELLRDSAVAGRVALVPGEAGIGKSTLINAFAARHGGRARVLWGVCDPLVTPRALGPLHDIGRQAGGTLAARLSTGSTQADLFAALMDELSGPRQRPRPVVVVEDTHWADEATLDLLVFLGRRIERLAALLVVTYRDDEVGPEHPLRAALTALPRHVVRTVPVAALSPECVAEQAARAGRDAAEAYRLTGGNPLLVAELLASDDGAAVPSTVRDLILARLRGLPEPARDVARLVAVMPTRAEPAALVGQEEPVDRCIAAGVLVPAGDGASYRHELLRRAVEDSLSPARRTALHRQALALLSGVDGVDPARLVHHARYAGDTDALLRYGVVAAAGAAAQGAHREAVAHYRALRPHADRLPAVERAELLAAYAFQAYLAGVAAEGLDAQRAALAEWERLGDRERIGESLRWVSRLAWWSGRGAEARAAAVRSVGVLEAGEPGRELAMAYSNRSQLHMLAHELAGAVAWGERAGALADRLGDLETAIHARTNVYAARMLGGDPTADGDLRREHGVAAAAGLVDHAARALVNRAAGLVDLGDYLVGAAAVDEALRYASAQDLDGYVQYLLGIRALIQLERCAWDAALADAEESLNRPSRTGVALIPALVARGRILTARGATDALSTLDRAADHAYPAEELQRIGPVAAARSEYFLLTGDPDRAAEEARSGLALAVAKGHRQFIDELAYRLWQATGEMVDPTDAGGPHRMLMAGDWAGAAREWARRGRGYTRLDALAAGDRPAAAEALRVLNEIGADRAAHRLRAWLRRRGLAGMPRGPRPATVANAAGLTPRQLEVLRLLAEGLSNAAIAARLTLSPKTVEHHISAVLEKLDVTTRGQAIAAAHRLNLVV